MKNARSIAIWVSGTIGCGIVGALIGDAMSTGFNSDAGFYGFIAGALLFACARLWLGDRPKPLPVMDLKDGRLQ